MTWQRRAARLGWVTVGLAALSVVLIALAAWILARENPRGGVLSAERLNELVLPVDVQIRAPRLMTVLALGLALGSVFVGLERDPDGDRHADPRPRPANSRPVAARGREGAPAGPRTGRHARAADR